MEMYIGSIQGWNFTQTGTSEGKVPRRGTICILEDDSEVSRQGRRVDSLPGLHLFSLGR